MKATEQYFPVVLFIMLYKLVLDFDSVDEILWCDHSHESYYWPFAKYPHPPLPSFLFNVAKRWARGRGKEGKKRLKVVAFPTLGTISSDFSMMNNMLF